MSEYRYFFFDKLLVVGVNLLMLAALFVAMYRASLYPDDFNVTFLKTLITLLTPVLVTGYVGKRVLKKRRAVESL
jgi:hypothetical protein